MCGIAGIITFRTQRDLRKDMGYMLDQLQERGPDSRGKIVTDSWAVGMTRLALEAVNDGTQPVSNGDDTIFLVFNGEIYNYLALAADFNLSAWDARCEASVLLALYELLGLDFLNKVEGMFAIAIVDRKSQTINLIRDHFGIKPLYVLCNANELIFASSPKAFPEDIYPLRINTQAYFEYMISGYIGPETSFYGGVEKVAPASIISCDSDGNLNQRQYWRPWSSEYESHDLKDEVINCAKQKIQSAIEDQFSGERKKLIFLSGGVDSSSIATLAANSGSSVEYITVNYCDKPSLDAISASKFASHHKLNLHTLDIRPRDYLIHHKNAMKGLHEPNSDSAMIGIEALTNWAAQNNLPICYSGAGGDEFLGGYPRHFNNARNAVEGRLSGIKETILSNAFLRKRKVLNVAASRWLSRASQTSGSDIKDMFEIFNERKLSEALETYELKIDRYFPKNNKELSFEQRLLYDLYTYLPGNILALSDQISMNNGVEIRVPLTNHKIWDYLSRELIIAYLTKLPRLRNKGLLREIIGAGNGNLISRKEGFNAGFSFYSAVGSSSRSHRRDPEIVALMDELGGTSFWRNYVNLNNSRFNLHISTSFLCLHDWLVENRDTVRL